MDLKELITAGQSSEPCCLLALLVLPCGEVALNLSAPAWLWQSPDPSR